MSQPTSSPYANPEIVSRLQALWPTHSATEICTAIWNEFQVHVSRNSVVGRLHRDKMTVEDKLTVKVQTTRQRSPRVPRTHRPARQRFFATPDQPTSFVDVVMDPLNISFADIHDGQCKSIVNDDLTAPLYCGHWVEDGFHYCRPHRRLFYMEGKRWGERRAAGVPA